MASRETPLHGTHDDLGAKFTDFGGWQMPVEFDSIRVEHAAVREEAGIFDVSHMGQIEVSGPDATTLMQRLTTNDVTALDPGESQYSAITRTDGVIIDDTIVYRYPDGEAAGAADDETSFLFIPNAGHDEQMYDRWVDYRDDEALDATVENTTESWGMVAVQGPDAPRLVADAVTELEESAPASSVSEFSRNEAGFGTIAGARCFIAKTGYTGEPGFEVMCPTDAAVDVWGAFDCQPCGLGARDTLRIEKGFLLSGEDFHPEDEPHTPYEAGIGFAVKLDTEFIGRDALEAQKEEGIEERFTGVKLLDRGVPRGGYELRADGEPVGHLTSGTMSPTLSEPIALGYLSTDCEEGDQISVVVRGDEKRAKVVTPPFV
ncbi:glycine cleavage system aminomethyltransferase GcvT [Halalkaliarchaeum sp. AArc-CO]|uniref:glycine cleavage system aminomethyltransferase GcvT n=1 Tax=Halalkaliarchaeum sp. AArc-CO TaxID=2866381 RepID=UPI00217EB598|nr:glycine cleavage system aminomethyltransferase GcvT [Halalkaliarchaeum sp. AArc-CO]